jgi:hypothetical protein
MGVGGQRHVLAPVPLGLEAGWASGPVWTGVENLASLSGFGPRTAQPVASRYTDCVKPALRCMC